MCATLYSRCCGGQSLFAGGVEGDGGDVPYAALLYAKAFGGQLAEVSEVLWVLKLP